MNMFTVQVGPNRLVEAMRTQHNNTNTIQQASIGARCDCGTPANMRVVTIASPTQARKTQVCCSKCWPNVLK